MYWGEELFLRSLEAIGYLGDYIPGGEASREINTRIKLKWAHKHFTTTEHTLFRFLHDTMNPCMAKKGDSNVSVSRPTHSVYLSLITSKPIASKVTSVSHDEKLWHKHMWLDTVYPKKYAHGFCFAVLCCGYTLTDFPISIRLTSLALWQSNDCPSASKATQMNMDKYFMWIHYERLHNHNKAKHNKTVCIFLGIYCRYRFIHGHIHDQSCNARIITKSEGWMDP